MERVYYGKRVTDEHAPEEMDGKKLVFEEVFRSGFPKFNVQLAESVLTAIRSLHSSANGWVELEAWYENTPEGIVAVRHHAQYK